MSMKRLSKAAAGLGAVAVLLAGGTANARFSCDSAGDLSIAEAERMVEAVTVTVLSVVNLDYVADRLIVRFSLDGETPCLANKYRDGYCLKVEVKGETHEECYYGTPGISRDAFAEHIEVGPIAGRHVSTTVYARFGYFGPYYYAPWSDGITTRVQYERTKSGGGGGSFGR